MTDDIINSKNSQKMSVYCKTCVCKSCKQVAWLEQEKIELKAENEKLKECNEELTSDNLNTIQEMDNERRRVEQLKEENERLKEELSGKRFICKDCMAFAKRIEQYKQTLQEIKDIAEGNRDTSQYGGICKSILALITKAESEVSE